MDEAIALLDELASIADLNRRRLSTLIAIGPKTKHMKRLLELNVHGTLRAKLVEYRNELVNDWHDKKELFSSALALSPPITFRIDDYSAVREEILLADAKERNQKTSSGGQMQDIKEDEAQKKTNAGENASTGES